MRGASFVRWTLRGLVVLLALVAAAAIVLQTPWAHERARRAIEARAASALNGELTIGALGGTFWGDVTFSNVGVAQRGAPVISASSVTARYRPWRVFTTGTIDEIVVRGLHLNVIEEADGWNVLGLGVDRERDSDSPGPDIAIARLEIIDGTARIAPRAGAVRQIADLNFAGAIDYASRRLSFDLERATARDVDSGVAIRELSSEIDIADGDVSFDALHLATAGSRVDGTVRVRRDDDVEIDVSAAPLSLDEIAHYVPQLRRVGVSPDVTLSARGTTTDAAVRLSMRSDAGSLAGDGRITRPGGVTEIDATVRATRVNLARWLNDRDLESLVTADATIRARIPDAAPRDGLVTFDLRSPELVARGYRATTVRAKGRYRDGVLDVEGAAAAYGSAIRTTARWDGERLTARGHAMHVDVRRLPPELGLPALETDVTGTYDVALRGRAWRAEATLEKSVVDGATVAHGTVVHLNRESAELAYDVHGSVSNLNLATVRPFIELPPERAALLEGRVNARVAATGRSTDLDTAVADIGLQLSDSVIAGMQVPQLDLRASLNRRALSADVTGTVNQLTSEAIGVTGNAAFRADGVVEGHITLPDVRNPGRLDTASGRANVRLTNAAFRGVPIDALDVDASLAGGVAEVRRFELTSPDVKATAAGTLAVDESADIDSDLKYELTAADLSKLEALAGRPLRGGAAISGQVTGPASLLRARGDINLNRLAVAPVQALAVQGRYDVSVPAFDVSRATSRFTGTGTFVEIGDTKVDRFKADATYAGGRVDLETTIDQRTRTISMTGSMVPHPDHREVHVTALALAAGGPEWRLASGHDAVVRYAADRVNVSGLDLVSGASRITVSGAIGTSDPAAGPLAIAFDNVRVEEVNQLLLGTHKLTGRIDGTARVEGSIKAPRVSANVTIVNGEVDGIAYERIGAAAEYTGETLTVDAALEAGKAGRLTAVGTMPLPFGRTASDAAPPFDLRVESQTIDLGLLQPLTGDHLQVARGTGAIDLRVTGPARAPAIAGRVAVMEAAFTVAATGATYPRLDAVFAFDGTRLNVERFQIEDEDRHVATLTGGLNISVSGPPSDFNLNFRSDDFHLLNNQFGELVVTADLRAMGDLTTPLLSGTIAVDRARLEVDDLLDRFGSGGYTPVAPDPAADPAAADPAAAKPAAEQPSVAAERQAQQASAASNASFSITLAMPDTVVLRGRDLRARGGSFGLGDVNVTVGGALSLAKDSGGPTTVLGALEVVRGSYSFQGRRFGIARGSALRFDGEQVLNPALDVTAERQIGGVLARVRVTGTARAPAVELSSEPPLDEGDILSLIAFNQTMNELGTPQRVSLAARAGTLAARALATPLADSVARALDFDVFEIQPSDEGATGATITVGRQITEDLFVGFRQDFGADDVSQVSFEYRINEFLRLVTSFAQGAERSRSIPRAETAGLDLFVVIRRE